MSSERIPSERIEEIAPKVENSGDLVSELNDVTLKMKEDEKDSSNLAASQAIKAITALVNSLGYDFSKKAFAYALRSLTDVGRSKATTLEWLEKYASGVVQAQNQ